MKPIDIPSDEVIKSKLNTRKASKRNPRRKFKVLTDKLTREHVRLVYKEKDLAVQRSIEDEKAWKLLA